MAAGQDEAVDKWYELAQRHWLNSDTPKIRPETLKKELWNPLEAESFPSSSLASLESLQILERLLWPSYSDEATDQHVLLITVLVSFKQRGRLQDWDLFSDRQDAFSSLFRRVLSLSLDDSLSHQSRLFLLDFILASFQCLEKDFLRRECAPLVSVAILHNIHDEAARDRLLESRPGGRKAWRASQKRYDGAEKHSQARMRFDRAWLYSMILDFYRRINKPHTLPNLELLYCEKFLELLTDLISQLPTRRYSRLLLSDLNLVPVIRNSSILADERSASFQDLCTLVQHFCDLDVDEDHPHTSHPRYSAFTVMHTRPHTSASASPAYGRVSVR